MSRNCYLTNNMRILDGKGSFNYEAALELQKTGKCLVDARSNMVLVLDDGKRPPYSMTMFCNYTRSLRQVLNLENYENGLAFVYMGYIPILCEPSFTNGVYAEYIMPLLEKSGLPLYRRPPMSFCGRACDFAGTDIWVHKSDCVKVLGLGCRPEHVKLEDVFKALGVHDFDSDVSTLH